MSKEAESVALDGYQFNFITMDAIDGTVISGYRLLESSRTGKKLVIPDIVKNLPVLVIGNDCFAGAAELEEIVLPSALQIIEQRAFRFSGLTTVLLPNSLAYIGNAAFEGCEHLCSVTCGTNLQQIASYAFMDCKELRAVKRSGLAGELKLGAWTFAKCPLLHEFDLGGVTLDFMCFAGNEQWQGITEKADRFMERSKKSAANSRLKVAKKQRQTAEALYENHKRFAYIFIQARHFAKHLLLIGILVIAMVAIFVSHANRNQPETIPSMGITSALTAMEASSDNTSLAVFNSSSSTTTTGKNITTQSVILTTTEWTTTIPTTSRPTTNPTTTSRPTTTLPPTIRVNGVSINSYSSSVSVGSSGTLTATVSPNNAADKSVSWKSGNNLAVAVKSNGEWKALNRGQATITVTTTDGKYTDSITITVN